MGKNIVENRILNGFFNLINLEYNSYSYLLYYYDVSAGFLSSSVFFNKAHLVYMQWSSLFNSQVKLMNFS